MGVTLESQPRKSEGKTIRPEQKLLMSCEEAATLLSISRRSLDYLIANKAISVRRIGSRVLIPVKDLQHFARADHPGRIAG